MSKQSYFCIHGHFYQPPRENPWIEEIECQDSALPFHDWNERIHHECYLPNSRARALDTKGRIVDIVNNFERISFNIGPTLMSWLDDKHLETYKSIIRADQVSRKIYSGHGNALAQVYNHMIMPLANGRDKRTQVRWGITEFKYRFNREPEGMWLPETACNDETLEILIEKGIVFTILCPHQAEAVRKFDGQWVNVSSGSIDLRQPYRYFSKNNPQKFIAIFFYDGPISKDLGFGDLLFDAKLFMNRLEEAVIGDSDHPQLIHIATDGETYGHHKVFGDRALAYLTYVEIPKRGYKIMNYGEFLEKNPPASEVKIKKGEGTSWSCSHGVKRWKEHCGCRGDGPAEWNQHWRKPLRESLNWLRDASSKIYEEYGVQYLKDIWRARDEYINIILNRDVNNIKDFLSHHASRELSQEEIITCLKLLEIERHAMLMFTSCGWFFSEMTGIETLQILQYAARTIQLTLEISDVNLEDDFLKELSHAKSNLKAFSDGRDVYLKLVKPAIASLEHIVSFYAMGSVFEDYYPEKENIDIYCFKLRVVNKRKELFGNSVVGFGRVKILSKITLEERDFVFTVIQMDPYDFRCSVKPFTNAEEVLNFEKDLFGDFCHDNILELFKKIDDCFGEKYFTLKNLMLEDRKKIIMLLTKEQIQKVSQFYEKIYDENRRMNAVYRAINLPIPSEFRYAAEHVLSKRLIEEVRKLKEDGFSLKKAASTYRLFDVAKSFKIEIQKTEAAEFLSNALTEKMKIFVRELKADFIQECINIHKISEKIDIELDQRQAQDDLFSLLRQWRKNPKFIPASFSSHIPLFLQLMIELKIAPDEFKKLIINMKKEQ